MKKLIFIVGILLCFTMNTNAQGILDRLSRGAKDAAESAVQRQVNKKVEKEVDKAFEGEEPASENDDQEQTNADGWVCPACGHEGNTGKFCTECGAKQPVASDGIWTCSACGHEGNKGKFCTECGAKQPTGDNGSAAASPEKTIEITYAKCDFVAGDEIIFEDNLANEQLGEFPSQWDLLRGSAEVASLNGVKCINLESGANATIAPLMTDMTNYLPDVFTIEFDYWINNFTETNQSPSQFYQLYLLNSEERTVLSLEFGEGHVSWNYLSGSDDERNGTIDHKEVIDSWSHMAISFNKRAFKAYINGNRVVNIPNMAAPASMKIKNTSWDDHRTLITNIRIAKGAVPLYNRMMTDGKFITYGITFDVGKATIKPESMGEINRIVKLMTDNPDLKFSVEGHTDNTGNAASNQTLSEARSKAIVDKLVEMDIAADRLTSAGKGQNSPIADNNTDEGRAKNRRVEFVKK